MPYDEFNVNFKPTESPVAKQEGIFGGLNQGYAGAIGGQTKVPQLINQYDTQFNVPQLQQQIQQGTEQYDTLGNQIRGMSQGVQQGAQESIMTQGQLDRVTQARQAPLLEQQNLLGQNLGRMGSNLATAQSNASRMVEAEQVQQQKELSPWLQAFDNENVLSSMRMTGWSFENQSELSRLLANQQAGITLSEGDKNRMQQLAVAEANFQNQLKLNDQGFRNDQAMAQQNAALNKDYYTFTHKNSGAGTYTPNFNLGTVNSNQSLTGLFDRNPNLTTADYNDYVTALAGGR